MAKYTGPKCKLCRREQTKLFLKGERCYSDRCAIEKKNYPPGQRGRRGFSRRSNYRLQLREKQKLKRYYQLMERQFHNYYKKADNIKGVTGENLMVLLESRLDNLIYRMGFAPSRSAARQFVMHNHFEVNGRRVNIPSYQVQAGDRIAPCKRSSKLGIIEESLKKQSNREMVPYISVDADKKEGVYLEQPTRDVIPVPVTESLIVELYSK